MAEDDKIKYSDIIVSYDSIEKLVKQLGELNQSYETMVNAIRAGADRIVHSPKSYIGSESVEIKYDKQFESTCLLIAQKTSMDAKKMTVLQFYNAVDNIKQQLEAESKSVKRHKRK